MRTFLLSKCVVPVAMFAAMAGCKDGGESEASGGSSSAETSASTQSGAQTGGGEGGSGGGTGGGSGGGGSAVSTGSGGSSAPGWTIVPLVDDESDPDVPIWHAGNSLVPASTSRRSTTA